MYEQPNSPDALPGVEDSSGSGTKQEAIKSIGSGPSEDRTHWIPLWALRLDVGTVMRDSLVIELARREFLASGRETLARITARDGSRVTIVHPHLEDAVRAWYRDQDRLLSAYVPSALAGSRCREVVPL